MNENNLVDFSFEYGVCDQITPLVRRVIAKNPGPFTYTGTGTYIIGSKELAVIDPGPIDESHLQAILNATKNQKITPCNFEAVRSVSRRHLLPTVSLQMFNRKQ